MAWLAAAILGALAYVAAAVWSVAVFLTMTLSSLIGSVGGIVGMIAKGIGQAVAPAVDGLSTLVVRTSMTVRELVRNLAVKFADTVGNVTKPILEPIRDALVGVNSAVGNVQTWVKTTLAPLEGVIDTVEELSGYFMIYKTLANIHNISDGLDVIAEKVGLETAAKIAELGRQIVDIGLSTVDYVQNMATAFDQKVVHADERIKEANRAGINELRLLLDEKVLGIKANLSLKETKFDRIVRRIERRQVDLPQFMGMMIRALR